VFKTNGCLQVKHAQKLREESSVGMALRKGNLDKGHHLEANKA